MLKALNNMYLILSYQIRLPTITMKLYILKSIRRKLKCFINSLAFFAMFRYGLIEDKTMHITITFRCHTETKLTRSFFYRIVPTLFERQCSYEITFLIVQILPTFLYYLVSFNNCGFELYVFKWGRASLEN